MCYIIVNFLCEVVQRVFPGFTVLCTNNGKPQPWPCPLFYIEQVCKTQMTWQVKWMLPRCFFVPKKPSLVQPLDHRDGNGTAIVTALRQIRPKEAGNDHFTDFT